MKFHTRTIANAVFQLAAATLLYLWTPAAAEEKRTLYTVNDGLSQHSVTSIIQDKNEMLWIGTFDGLNSFDGRVFQTYRHFHEDTTSIANNRVLAITQDENSDLWVLLANNHVAHLYPNGTFRNYRISDKQEDLGNEVRFMTMIDGHLIITGARKSTILFQTDRQKGTTPAILSLKRFIDSCRSEGENVLSIDTFGNWIWISTTSGIYCSSGEGDFMKMSDIPDHFLKATKNGYIVLWQNESLIICNPVYSKNERTVMHVISRNELTSSIQNVEAGRNGIFWIGTMNGLYKCTDGKIEEFSTESPVRALLCDNMGVVWSGGLNGLESINPYSQPFSNFRFSGKVFSLDNHISSILSSPFSDEIFAGVTQKGLCIIGYKETADGEKKMTITDRFFPNSNVSMICSPSPDTVLAGSKDGLKMLVRKNRKYHEERIDPDIRLYPQPYRVSKDNGWLWISNEKRLFKMRYRNGKAIIDRIPAIQKQLPQRSIIISLQKDPSDSSIWIGYRGNGLYRICPADSSVTSFEKYTGLEVSNKYIWDIFFDSTGKMWIGTDAGLDMVFRTEEGFRKQALSAKDGLRNDKIETIEEDDEGRIWAGTSQELLCYDPRTKEYTVYDHEDGVQSNNFVSASDKMKDGTLIFGGIAGFSYFRPSEFNAYNIAPSLHIRKISASGKEIAPDEWKDFSLKNKNKDVRIELSSYYSPNPGKIRYRYAVNSKEWTETTSDDITLTDLRPGKYAVKICCDAGLNKTSPIQTISFTLRRPMMLSLGALSLYLIVIALIVMAILRNIFSRKLLDNRLKMEEALHESERKMNAEKLNFYTNMAHEIKTPLSLILGRLYDIETCDEASPYIVRKVKLIEDNAGIIKELTEQILEFKKAVSGKLELEIQKQDIMPCIRKIVDNYMDYANKRGITLELESSAEEIVRNVNAEKIVRILYNLISNAIKFSEQGDRIVIKVIGKPESLVITVSDTGSGISKEDLPHIFEQFYKSGKAGGSGIGLAFTKSLVELMGGTIVVDSTEGEGSTFVVTIPEHEETPVKEKKSAEPVKAAFVQEIPESGNASVLLVEDNVELNEYIEEILSVRFHVLKAYNGKEAMEILKKEHIDLVLSDVMMPNTDGIELARKIKSIKNLAHIPIVFLSAKTTPEDQLTGLKTGAVDYITKPFNPHILLIKIQNILSQYYLSKANFKEKGKQAIIGTPAVNRDELFINKAREIIYENMGNEEFGVTALSEAMGISRVHLAREFQRILTQSPSSFIKSIRLNQAKYLLSSSDISIKEVLWEIGIKSHSGFTKAFREEFGYLPSQIMKNKEQKHNNDRENEN